MFITHSIVSGSTGSNWFEVRVNMICKLWLSRMLEATNADIMLTKNSNSDTCLSF